MRTLCIAIACTLAVVAFPVNGQGAFSRAKDTYAFYRTYVSKPGKVVELFASIEAHYASTPVARDYSSLSNSYLESAIGIRGAAAASNFAVGPVAIKGRSSKFHVTLSGLTKRECETLEAHPANELFSRIEINGLEPSLSTTATCRGSLFGDWLFAGKNVIRYISR